MRDPSRIDRLLDLLREIWKLDPDLRLGQIVSWESIKHGHPWDPFYVEDDEMEAALRARLAIETEIAIRQGRLAS